MKITFVPLFIFLLHSVVFLDLAVAFPDMIRHGYTNCTACHVSPSGGGVLNAYGRNLSKDLISTWSGEKEHMPLHGLFDTSKVEEWLAVGGDYRAVQVHQENEQIKRGSWINMQAGVEVALMQPHWAVVSFIGQYMIENGKTTTWQPYSPRYYAFWNPKDELFFKVGRFLPNYGINFPDHIISTRAALGYGYGQEKNSAEVLWLGENWNFSGTYYQTPEPLSNQHQTGVAAMASRTFLENMKVGLQFSSEKDDQQSRQLSGAHAYLSWSKKFYTLLDLNQQTTSFKASSTDKKGVFAHHRTGYEIYKGVNFIFLNDYTQSDIYKGITKDYKYGPGLQWLPRPHFDIQAFWTRQQKGTLTQEGDYAWLVLHYYL